MGIAQSSHSPWDTHSTGSGNVRPEITKDKDIAHPYGLGGGLVAFVLGELLMSNKDGRPDVDPFTPVRAPHAALIDLVVTIFSYLFN